MTASLLDHAPTGVFDRSRRLSDRPHERVVFCQDAATGLRAIVAIHSTALGPALGGTRFYPYVDEATALEDVLRLSWGMTYKAAVAGVNLGGGKAVILGDPATDKSDALLAAYGRFVESLGGRYVTAAAPGTQSDAPPPPADPGTARRSPRSGCSAQCGPGPNMSGAQHLWTDARSVSKGSGRWATSWCGCSSPTGPTWWSPM